MGQESDEPDHATVTDVREVLKRLASTISERTDGGVSFRGTGPRLTWRPGDDQKVEIQVHTGSLLIDVTGGDLPVRVQMSTPLEDVYGLRMKRSSTGRFVTPELVYRVGRHGDLQKLSCAEVTRDTWAGE